MKSITLLIPVYNESKNLEKLCNELQILFQLELNYSFRVLFVDDGSSDNTVDIIENLIHSDDRIQLIELSRNFGKEAAVTAGLDYVSSDALVIMDADLQHPPVLISDFIREWEKGYDIVATKRIKIDKQPMFRRIGSHFFYRVINLISETEMISNTTDFRLLDKKVVDALRSFTERNRLVRGIIDWMGFKKTFLEFSAPQRFAGQSVYSYGRLFALAINSFTSFSLFPLKLTGFIGLFITLFSFPTLCVSLIDRLFFKFLLVSNIVIILLANSFFMGITLMSLGMIALYIGNIHREVLNRPLYIVRRHIRHE